MALFNRRDPQPEAPAKPARAPRTKPLALRDVDDAIAAARAQLYSESNTVRTLSALAGLLDDHALDGVVAKLPPGPLSVTGEQLDAALEELEGEIGSHSMSVLKRARSLLLASERTVKEKDTSPVTREEFDVLKDALIQITAVLGASVPGGGLTRDSLGYRLDRARKTYANTQVGAVLQRFDAALAKIQEADWHERDEHDHRVGRA